MHTSRWLAMLVSAFVLIASGAVAQKTTDETEDDPRPQMIEEVVVHVAESEEFGLYLADAEGRPFYTIVDPAALQSEVANEPMNEGIRASAVPCIGECLDTWPGVFSGFADAGDAVSEDMLYVATNMEGNEQVVYNGWPLYMFSRDADPRGVAGHGVEDFGGTWFLVSPDGSLVQATGMGGAGAMDDAAREDAADDAVDESADDSNEGM